MSLRLCATRLCCICLYLCCHCIWVSSLNSCAWSLLSVYSSYFQFIPINYQIQFIVQILYKTSQTMCTEVSNAFNSQLMLHSSRLTNMKRNNRAPVSLLSQDLKCNICFHFPSYLEKQNQCCTADMHKWSRKNVLAGKSSDFQNALLWQALKSTSWLK